MSKFNTTSEGIEPVIFDFFAPCCGPCQSLAPALKEIEKERGQNIRTLKVDIDQNKYAAAAFSVKSVPTLIIYNNGQIQWRHVGQLSKKDIRSAISQHI